MERKIRYKKMNTHISFSPVINGRNYFILYIVFCFNNKLYNYTVYELLPRCHHEEVPC
jgi:hypothetical protein